MADPNQFPPGSDHANDLEVRGDRGVLGSMDLDVTDPDPPRAGRPPMPFDVTDPKDLKASRAKLTRRRAVLRAALGKLQALIARRDRQLRALPKDGQRDKAVRFLLARIGRHEDAGRPNRAAWLDRWARRIGAWMVGGPWCGLAVYMALHEAGVNADPRTVSTVAIRDMAKRGTGGFLKWVAWADVERGKYKLRPGDVLIYGSATSGPVHTGTYAGGNNVAEGNTSPEGAGGSQNNGGGLYLRKLTTRRAQHWILGVAVPAYTH